MFYMKVIDFLITYDVFILPAAFLAVWIFGIINWSKNVYRKQNRALETCRANVLRDPKFAGVFVAALPEEYRRQWRAFVNGKAERPSQVFEFVPRKNKTTAVHLFVLCTLVSCAYLALFVYDVSHREYLVFQFAFWLAFALVMVVDLLIFRKKEKRARQIFGRFVAQLNAVKPETDSGTDKTVAQKISGLKSSPIEESIVRASKILRENGLEGERTAEEQKDINTALNGLLQAYSNSSAQTGDKI